MRRGTGFSRPARAISMLVRRSQFHKKYAGEMANTGALYAWTQILPQIFFEMSPHDTGLSYLR